MNPEVKTKIILYKSRERKDGRFRVKLRINFRTKQKYYPTKFALNEKEFDEVNSLNARTEFKKIKKIFVDIENKAIDIINNLPDFTFEAFENRFKNPKGIITLTSYYETFINQLKKEGRIGTLQNYQSSINSLKCFSKNKELLFKDITPNFLIQYEKWMLQAGNTISTVGIYTRPLRAIFNKAIREKAISETYYPFGKDKYQIPAGQNIKKTLKITDIEQIFNYSTILFSSEDKAKDMWFFSYLCNGINIKDICRLKYKNITI
ncbi:MAG TPA: phage integrase SAM-like domain-containing protein, partial [Bacteroidales bacterium]